jgi:hypothetical protein
MTNAKHNKIAPKLAKERLAPANLARRLVVGGFILDNMMVRLAGVAEPPLGIHPQGIVGLENIAELLRGFPVKSGERGLATRLGGKPDALGEIRVRAVSGRWRPTETMLTAW